MADVRTMDESVKGAVILDQQNEKSVKSGALPKGASAAASTNVGTMGEAVKAAAVPDQ